MHEFRFEPVQLPAALRGDVPAFIAANGADALWPMLSRL